MECFFTYLTFNVFVATMHARDRRKLEQQLLLPLGGANASSISLGDGRNDYAAYGAQSVRVVYASNASDMAERVETGVRRQEDPLSKFPAMKFV